MNIYAEIKAERGYQNRKWGDAFDDKNTINDWVTYIAHYASLAAFTGELGNPDGILQREYLLKAAALCVAAIEAFDRNNKFPKRHYE